MGKFDREYEAFRIFEEILEQSQAEQAQAEQPQAERIENGIGHQPAGKAEHAEAPYYEIEYDSCPMPGVGRFVLKSSKIEAPKKDETRDIFNQMRDIARKYRTSYFNSSKFYNKAAQQENAKIFYKQGMFMKDFKDEYDKSVHYSSYYPSYQMMGYDQLRTYFTWRTKVRQKEVENTSLSYAFLYIYELLNNIGVDGPEEGLEKLMFFWEAYRIYDGSIDKYMLQWVKDYHIYYELPRPFKEFLEENCLEAHYPELSGPEDKFDLFCSISKYDIRKSVFFCEGNMEEGHSMEQGNVVEKVRSRDFIKGCFYFVLDRLKQVLAENRINFDEFIFQPAKNMVIWTPFKGALFYPAARQQDRKVVLSEREIYLCSGNRWTFNTVITAESGKRLIGYCMKQMESTLRKAVKYKYRLSASTDMLSPVMAAELQKANIFLEKTVTEASLEYYREATKTVVSIDSRALERIREEALATQEKLIVPEQEEFRFALSASAAQGSLAEQENTEIQGRIAKQEDSLAQGSFGHDRKTETGLQTMEKEQAKGEEQAGEEDQTKGEEQARGELQTMEELPSMEGLQQDIASMLQQGERTDLAASASEPWDGLKAALEETEKSALLIVLNGETDIKHFADSHGIMLEVLMDRINEKAMDFIGDNLLDSEFQIYEDYAEQVKGMVETG